MCMNVFLRRAQILVVCRLEKERELDGLDVSNIVVGDRRARRTAAPINYAAIEAANSSDDDSSEAEQQDSEDKQDAGSDAGMVS